MLEPEMEAFLLRIAPSLANEWQGASEQEIDAIERIAGQELPRYYRWFLSKMGRDAGPLEEPFAAYSAQTVLSAYENGEVDVEPPLLFIARMEDPFMSLEMYYDLGRRTRDDAFVVNVMGGELSNDAETLRERMAWTALIKLRVNTSAQWCRGRLKDHGGDVAGQLGPVLADIGFTSPIPTGPYCGVYERADAALACKVEAEAANGDLLIFNLGGPDSGVLRRILGEIATKTSIEVTISKWAPPLPK